MRVSISKRSDYGLLTLPDYDYSVERYSHAAQGGPKLATIRVKGDDIDLWRLMELIRCPLKIHTDRGEPTWWGYISGVELTALNPDAADKARVKAGVSIDNMANTLAVAYNLVDLTSDNNNRDTTAWFSDVYSIAEYGVKELLWTCSAATQQHANAAGTAKLYQTRYPNPSFVPASEETESYAILTGRGWWDTLDWRYYANAGTASIDTAAQCGTILASKGQFFSSVAVETTAGIAITQYRDGDATALYEVTQLLEMGTNNYRRMLATVDQHRVCRVYEEPAVTNLTYGLSASGKLFDAFGTQMDGALCPVGRWARYRDVIPAAVNTSLLTDPTLVFIEEAEYAPARDVLTVRARGDPDPWNFPVARDG